jgi:hypothetical protein
MFYDGRGRLVLAAVTRFIGSRDRILLFFPRLTMLVLQRGSIHIRPATTGQARHL